MTRMERVVSCLGMGVLGIGGEWTLSVVLGKV